MTEDELRALVDQNKLQAFDQIYLAWQTGNLVAPAKRVHDILRAYDRGVAELLAAHQRSKK